MNCNCDNAVVTDEVKLYLLLSSPFRDGTLAIRAQSYTIQLFDKQM